MPKAVRFWALRLQAEDGAVQVEALLDDFDISDISHSHLPSIRVGFMGVSLVFKQLELSTCAKGSELSDICLHFFFLKKICNVSFFNVFVA